MPTTISINRAPVLTLWAAVVAEQLGFERNEALTVEELPGAVADAYRRMRNPDPTDEAGCGVPQATPPAPRRP